MAQSYRNFVEIFITIFCPCVAYLVCIIDVPLYSVWCVHCFASYNVWFDGNDVFVTGTDSPKNVLKQNSFFSILIESSLPNESEGRNVLPVSMDSFNIHCPVNKTASHTRVVWCLGNSIISPGTRSLLEIFSKVPSSRSTLTFSDDATVPLKFSWF